MTEQCHATFRIWRCWDRLWWTLPRDSNTLQGIDASDFILGKVRSRKSFYEMDLLVHLAGNGPRGGLAIDVGANIGNHTVFFAKYLADQVLSIEACRKIIDVLAINLAKNTTGNVICENVAAGASVGTARIQMPSGRNKGVAQLADLSADGELIDVMPLDLILSRQSIDVRQQRVQNVRLNRTSERERVKECSRRMMLMAE